LPGFGRCLPIPFPHAWKSRRPPWWRRTHSGPYSTPSRWHHQQNQRCIGNSPGKGRCQNKKLPYVRRMATTFRCIRCIQIVQESCGGPGTKMAASRIRFFHGPCRGGARPARPLRLGVPLIIRAGLAPTSHRVLPYLPLSQAVGATFPTAKPPIAPHGTRTFHAPPLPAASMTSIYIDRVPKSRNAATWVETETAGHPRRHPRYRLQ